MAFDASPGGDPRGPWCKRCKLPIGEDQPRTHMHFPQDPDGALGMSGLYHGECARPYWDTISRVLDINPWGKS